MWRDDALRDDAFPSIKPCDFVAHGLTSMNSSVGISLDRTTRLFLELSRWTAANSQLVCT